MKEIKRIRDRLKLSQTAFAELIGVGQGAINNYENGRRLPKVTIAKKMLIVAKKNRIKTSLEDIYREVL